MIATRPILLCDGAIAFVDGGLCLVHRQRRTVRVDCRALDPLVFVLCYARELMRRASLRESLALS